MRASGVADDVSGAQKEREAGRGKARRIKMKKAMKTLDQLIAANLNRVHLCVSSGNCDAARSPGLMRRMKPETRRRSGVGLETGDSRPTGLPMTCVTIRMGSTRSLSFERTAATSKLF